MSTNNVISFSSIKTKAAIAAIEKMQQQEETESNSPSMIEHRRLHEARVQQRAERLRSAFELVKN